MSSEINDLLQVIEQQLDWGDSAQWQSRDFEQLQQRIFDVTGVSLSASTLRRIWGRVAYNSLPSTTTLDALAKFAGYEHWRAFGRRKAGTAISPRATKRRLPLLLAGIVVVLLVLAAVFALRKAPPVVKNTDYRFSSQPITRSLPNSVIFTYDATASPTDSVYIQQSWDEHRREQVSKSGHQYTSIYYEPGFYYAKLVIGEQIVKEHPLLIPTTGWLGMIANDPVPVYLPAADFMTHTMLHVGVNTITQNNIPLQPEPPYIKYFNVGNFDPVPLSTLRFSTQVKNEYRAGAAACQFTKIVLITDQSPIVIPLSAKGCISDINLMSGDTYVSGKQADLSRFGVDFNDWVKVRCEAAGNQLHFYVNDTLAYSAPLPVGNVVGLGYIFKGTGAVQQIALFDNNKEVFNF